MKFLASLHMGENLEKVNKQTYLFFFFTYFEVMFIKKKCQGIAAKLLSKVIKYIRGSEKRGDCINKG